MDRDRARARGAPAQLDAARTWARYRRRMASTTAHPRAVRRAAGLARTGVARALGIHERTLRRWESGAHRPREVEQAAEWLDLLDGLEAVLAEAEHAGALPATGTEGGRGAREP
jgi:DNA-binding transcriptional regulator YiaG